MTPDRNGQVITFYSYKGGTGRTMALANTAWILAANGQRVLVADWDLESPGLHRFFAPFLEPDQVATTGGVMDLILEYEWENTRRHRDASTAGRSSAGTPPPDWHRRYAKVHKYAFTIGWDFPGGGSLDLLLAGKHTPDYPGNVTGLNWDNFYNRLGGALFFDALREDMKRNYDYTLIDSRTGISDVAEICTIHLPDVLVDCFTLSEQGIDGAASVAARVQDYVGTRARRVLPVPMRVDEGEKAKADAGLAVAMQRFAGLPAGMTDSERQAYWLTLAVPYRVYYAYEETLATFGDVPGSQTTLLSAYERLTAHVTGNRITSLPPIDEALRRRTVGRFERKPAIVDELIVLRYVPADQAWAEWVHAVLGAAGLRVLTAPVTAPATVTAGTAFRDLVLLSRTYLAAHHGQLYPGVSRPGSSPPLAVYVDDSTATPDVPVGNWVSLHDLPAGEASRQLLELVDRAQPGEGGPGVRGVRYPGVTAAVFNPPARNARFTGREQLLLKLREELKAGSTEGMPVALRGGAGIGKTQLAIEYAHRFRGAYDVIWWVPADPPQFVDIRVGDLGPELGIPHQPTVPEMTRAVRQQLARADRRADGGPPMQWLLIFDNADQYEHVREFLPQGKGHILVTTRNPEWGDLARAVDVAAFERAESVAYLRTRIGEDSIGAAEAGQVADAVENVPIFVEMAGAWLADTGTPVADYLAGLERSGPARDPWDQSLERLKEGSAGAYRLLQLASVLAPEISLDLLYGDQVARVIAAHDPVVAARVADRVSERDIAAALVQRINRLALIKLDFQAQQVQVHRLLQAALRARMSTAELAEVQHDVHLVLAGSRPPGEVDDPASHPKFRILWPHLDGSGAVSCPDENVRQLVIDRIRYIYLLGGYEQGLEYAEQAETAWAELLAGLSSDSQRHRKLQVQLLHLGFNKANLHRSLGRFDEAHRLDGEILRQQEELIGESHPHTLMTAGGYGGDLRALGRYGDALDRDLKTYAASVEVFGEDNRRTLIAANNLAASYRLIGDFRRALDGDGSAHRRLLVVLGADHPRSLITANNLARDLREAGDYKASVTLLNGVVEGYRNLFGDQSRDVLVAKTNLAASLRSTGELDRAAELLDEACGGLRSSFGAANPDTMFARLGRAITLQMSGKVEQARLELVEVEEMFVEVFGAEHPYVLVCRKNLGVTMWDVGDRPAALAMTTATARSLADTLGDAHPFTMAAANNLAVFTILSGEPELGHIQLTAIVDRMCELLGEDHPDALRSRGNLAIADQERSPEASGIERMRIADRLADRVGQHHPSVTALREGRYVRRLLDPHPY
ncbi:tetratricopeptide repeat protein [Plantactinospora sp. S1510]|uniref:Tetratricopeptide repeat protein n=1 Tax=Plantactinospora alkalitolerans TaxID=2789879 RepID=A0ABS0GTP1_9ACTN|nr:FxSxx-COOH system tetratricopeptide repeat protein [Plantactinospora alkalitolerans]MBF9129557.1 tetratricopeptide repeat protein [Plantactinospora alkalitolerans]